MHDRRSGDRVEVAAVPSPALSRHEQDELFGVAVTAGLECGVMMITGSEPSGVVPPDFYGRLAADLRSNGCRALADLTGPEWGFAQFGHVVDHVLVRGAELGRTAVWPKERRRLGGVLLSDHAPIEAEIA